MLQDLSEPQNLLVGNYYRTKSARLFAQSSKIYPQIKKAKSDDYQQYQLLKGDQRVEKNPCKSGKPLFVKIKRYNGDALEKINRH